MQPTIPKSDRLLGSHCCVIPAKVEIQSGHCEAQSYSQAQTWILAFPGMTVAGYVSRLRAGNKITSRMLGLSVSSIIRRSMPMPQPPVGGMPYSRTRMKSCS